MEAKIIYDSTEHSHFYSFCGLRFIRGRKSWVSVERWNDETGFMLEGKIKEISAIVPCNATEPYKGMRRLEIPVKTSKKVFK